MNTIKKLVSFLCFMIITIFACDKDNLPIPEGWRGPFSTEFQDDWRKDDINRYVIVKGDFNGDGIIDEARLLVLKDGSSLGLFVFLSQEGRTYKMYLLDEMKGSASLHAMGIKNVSPGLYKSACGKGYWECDKDEVPEVAIKNDAIDYFKTESANSYFYWDAQTNTFKRIWISD